MKKSIGFTLIELLIVVAIIAILAAIAVPNFLEAQTRSKIARCRADMRTVVTGLESFYIDKNWYPPDGFPFDPTYGYNANPATTGCSWIPTEIVKVGWFAQWPDAAKFNFWRTDNMIFITTPIAYLTGANLHDPFSEKDPTAWWKGSMVWENYMDRNKWSQNQKPPQGIVTRNPPYTVDGIRFPRYVVSSIGADLVKDNVPVGVKNGNPNIVYDPTNGTTSFGNIFRCQ